MVGVSFRLPIGLSTQLKPLPTTACLSAAVAGPVPPSERVTGRGALKPVHLPVEGLGSQRCRRGEAFVVTRWRKVFVAGKLGDKEDAVQ